MKGDFTRFTFQPQKHYSSVLMQQGRLQIDADWNEQMSILSYLNQVQTQDLIGSGAGTSSLGGGYQILPAQISPLQSSSSAAGSEDSPITDSPITDSPITDSPITDLLITEGRFYIDGTLCELNAGTSVPVTRISPQKIQVPSSVLDNQIFASDQWVELEIRRTQDVDIQRYKILEAKLDELMLTLAGNVINEPTENTSIYLRRLTTYKKQANYPNPEPLKPGLAINLVYLDVWQRHVTALDDRSLKEVALNGLDTTTRLQTIAQVKLLNITTDLDQLATTEAGTGTTLGSTTLGSQLASSYDKGEKIFTRKPDLADFVGLPTWQNLINRSVLMNATTATSPESSDTSGDYLGGDHRLYRVEIHRDDRDPESAVICKWSRDNGSIVSAIDRIDGDIVFLRGSIQEEYQLFSPTKSQENPWVEIITEAQELHQQPGILVQLRGVKAPNLLLLDLSQVQGGALSSVTAVEAERQKMKVRRWDGQINPTAEWQLLEQGIQVQFPDLNLTKFRNGDFWLLPVRAGRPLDWVRDLPQSKSPLGKPLPQPPLGIEHHYGVLAIVKAQKVEKDGKLEDGFSPAVVPTGVGNSTDLWKLCDLRTIFVPLLERSNSEASLSNQPEAELYVSSKNRAATGTFRKISDKEIGIAETESDLRQGYTVTIGSETAIVEAVNKSGGELRLTLDRNFSSLPTAPKAPFTYRKPLVRLETSNAIEPQLFIHPLGNVGINTAKPTAKLDIRGNSTEAIDFFQIKSEVGTLFKIEPDGQVGIGVEQPEGVLDVRTAGNSLFAVKPDGKIGIGINQPQGILEVHASGTMLFTVQPTGSVGIGIDQPQAKLDVLNTFRITTPGTPSAFLQIAPQANQPIAFTSHGGNAQGYSFDQKVTIREGGITVMKGGANLTADTKSLVLDNTGTTIRGGITLPTGDFKISSGGLTIGNDTDAMKMSLTTSSGLTIGNDDATKTTLTNDTLQVENLTVRKSFTLEGDGLFTFDRAIDFSRKITANGDLETDGNVTIKLSGNETISLRRKSGTDPVIIDLPKEKLDIQKGKKPLVTLSPLETTPPSSNPRLHIAGNVSIGADPDYGKPDAGLLNGLLVQGRVQIATKDLTPDLTGMPDADQSELTLYAKGNAYINGKLFAQKVNATTIEQVSSRSLKENITALSTPEAQLLLAQLTPVKFNYLLPIDPTPRVGFIAEEVPDFLTANDRQSVRLLDIIAVLTKTVKDLNQTIQEQQSAIDTLVQNVEQLSRQRSDRTDDWDSWD
jgi:Family of unknown function (DUF6519)